MNAFYKLSLFVQGCKMIIHTRIRYSILLIIPLILLILLPTVSFADAGRIFKENSKAVVVVTAYDEKGNAISQGSGFIVRRDGAVVTNYHVISKASDIKVKVGDKLLDVEGLIFTDKENDLVILKVKADGMPVVKLGVIEKANIGESVYVISSPVGFENTISDGLLSGIRMIDERSEILQITAPVSPGSSGGPVFNGKGEVVGVVTMLIKEAQNLNFAMPVKLIKDKIRSKSVTAISESRLEDYEKTADYWSNLGVHHYQSAMYREAIEAYKRAIMVDPDYAIAHNSLGCVYGALGMYREEIEAYKQAIMIDPDYAKPHYNLGFAYGALGMYREEIEAYKQAIMIDPDYVMAHNNLGFAYRALGMHKDAIEAYKQAIMIDPDEAKPRYNLGNAYSDLGMYREAIEAYKQAIMIDPDDAKPPYNLGFAYRALGMYREEIEAYKQAIMIDPDYAKAHYNLGFAYVRLNDGGSALGQYEILKSLDPELANKLFNLIYNDKKLESVKRGNSASVFATKDSNVFHRRNCSWFDATKNLVEFSSSQQARNDGGLPCSYCNP
jgi:tetratricopeptide (TPR) repeat protein